MNPNFTPLQGKPIQTQQQPGTGQGGDFSHTSDYHMNMSNWLHSGVQTGRFNNMSGKQIVQEFNLEKQRINALMAQKQAQAQQGMQRMSAVGPAPMGSYSPFQGMSMF